MNSPGRWSRIKSRLTRSADASAPWVGDTVLRDELFSAERLEAHAAALAATHGIGSKTDRRRSLTRRLRDNERILLGAYRSTAAAVAAGNAITPAAEWVLDNFHLVEEQIREILHDLPPGFYKQLPKLTAAPFTGYPRVFAIAWAFVAHTDSRLDPKSLCGFLRAYQRVQPLTIGELWAVAITLRIVLVENLRRSVVRTLRAREARVAADEIADRLLGLNGHERDLDALMDRDGSLDSELGFDAQLIQRLRDQDPRETPALQWLEDHLSSRGTSGEVVVSEEHQRQGASNVTVRNIITSMRLISEVDWADLFESVSLVDDALGAHSGYQGMDFATRNQYRSAIEDLARHSPCSELEIARQAMAHEGDGLDAAPPEVMDALRDPGHRLIGTGRVEFARSVGYRPPLRRRIGVRLLTRGPECYVGLILLAACTMLAGAAAALLHYGGTPAPVALLIVLGVVPALDLVVALVNRLATRQLGVTRLAGLALRDGVPVRMRTMVVVPVLLTDADTIAEYVDRLEVHYLACPEGAIHFALLCDGSDAPSEAMPEDAPFLAIATERIARLNALYPCADAGPRFLLLCRRRVWCETQRAWLGWERKRGKLHELNRLLRGATDTTFRAADGAPPPVPADVRFVVTLDADTRLPRDAVRLLIGKLAHPLNRPHFDASSGRIVAGYAVLQPRVTPSLPLDREGSAFQAIYSSSSGIDPYAAASSDVYQDLVGEGSYTGKGIYDVDAFEAALLDRIKPETLLSHDLFEGTFARAGLASDIAVVEEFPSRYDVATRRAHRWIRGDWQLLPWILGRSRAGSGGGDALSLISRWKMIDNLRRSLSAPATWIALMLCWTLPVRAALLWDGFLLVALLVPPLLPALAEIRRLRDGVTWRNHTRVFLHEMQLAAAQFALSLVMLPHQAWSSLDAILRTLHRLVVSRRRLLEWTTAERIGSSLRLDLASMYSYMAVGPLVSIATAIQIVAVLHRIPWIALPLLLLWGASPAVALWLSREAPEEAEYAIERADTRVLRGIARATWRYFETFVTASENWLPPDNFQEDPRPETAHRTSPTNMGLYLLSTLCARDFGWIGLTEACERLERTLQTMGRLQCHRGHFYNWYDTVDLRPLDPKYVSTVDSGNLGAHLLAAANAVEGWAREPATSGGGTAGIADAIGLARAAVDDLPRGRATEQPLRRELEATLRRLEATFGGEGGAGAGAIGTLPEAVLVAEAAADIARALAVEASADALTRHGDVVFWTEAIGHSLRSQVFDLALQPEATSALRARLFAAGATARRLAFGMDFGCLMNAERRLLSIGLVAADGALDPGCYDLLASEARLAVFLAVAKRDISARAWFRLGRTSAPAGNATALLSWSGSMFEYLMPSLVMREPAGSLLWQSNRMILQKQVEYGAARGIPWGISESAYNARDLQFTYQYSNFGVPGLGLKRGLSGDLVVAPYATALAAMVNPVAAVRNFRRIGELGARGRYGFYESIDFTRRRLPEGVGHALVRAYMAHHQGMSIVALANVVLDGRMRDRFHAEPIVEATELLLQERPPRYVTTVHPRAEDVFATVRPSNEPAPQLRRMRTPHDATPQTHLLSNGRYAVMTTAAGSGYTRWNDFSVTRWTEDGTRDDQGTYVFLRDVGSGHVWSAGFQPCGVEPDAFDAAFSEDRVVMSRTDGSLATTMELLVSSEYDADVRRVTLTNKGYRVREIEFTSYTELALAPGAADLAHPAFLKLFVSTDYVRSIGALVATRRPRSPGEAPIWVAQHAVVEGEPSAPVEVETDRGRFIGRGRELRDAIALQDSGPLSETVGTVLDPIFSFRHRLKIPPGSSVRIAYWTLVGGSREAVLGLLDKHRDPNAFARASTLAWTQAQVQLRHLGVEPAEAILFQRLAGHLLYVNGAMRPASDVLQRGMGPPAALWANGISGDLPILLLRVYDLEDMSIARQLLRAHEYWRTKQLSVDLVILNEHGPSYVQDLETALATAVRMSQWRPRIGGESAVGSVYLLRADLISKDADAVLTSVARVVLNAASGTLEDQLDRARLAASLPRPGVRQDAARRRAHVPAPVPVDLEFFNGVGGFALDGKEYVTVLGGGQQTPLPWINVIANPNFGFQVSAEGGGYTWSQNSREFKLTPWSNDPISDRPGEAIYVSDDSTGEIWGPTPIPTRDGGGHHRVSHGQGYSRFQHASHGIRLELLQFVPCTDAVKISRLTLTNESRRPRSLSVAAYTEWVLGASRSRSAATIVTEIDPETRALFARNPWNGDFGARVAFMDMRGAQSQWTADRREFLGRHGTLAEPAALMQRAPLSRRVGAGLDPCGVLRTAIQLEAGESVEIVILLGDAPSAAEARTLVERYRVVDVDSALKEVQDQWQEMLGTVQVATPDRAFDLLVNRWALYQAIACRLWARSAFYQSSGAYGFRDQLQDSMAIAAIRPALAREHVLRAIGRQFPEGDVQHWWHPHSGQGVRTRISDDPVWLAHAVAHVVRVTGDATLLDERVPFLLGRGLAADESDAYFRPVTGDAPVSVYEHCARALDRSLAVGVHGLPLIGTGDWNDGMNLVGSLGRGESVWLAWFLYATLEEFEALAASRGDSGHVQDWRRHRDGLRAALDAAGWDGEWYRRGFYDDGTTLGSAADAECQIDSIAQSWSVLSGAGTPPRPQQAMLALDHKLLDRSASLALLFTPAFEHSPRDPGYIKGYPAGVRENGGQYSHAAAWTVLALGRMGEGDRAFEVLRMINPIARAASRADVYRYKVEPYVVAADIYSRAPHAGRGGWTWYTGAAGCIHRAALEGILGIHRSGDRLRLAPALPRGWPRASVVIRNGGATYCIAIENPGLTGHGIARIEVDGAIAPPGTDEVSIADDGGRHEISVILGLPPASP